MTDQMDSREPTDMEQLTWALKRLLTATTRQQHLMWLKHTVTLVADVDEVIVDQCKATASEIVRNELRSMENPKKFLQQVAKASDIDV